MRRIKYPPLISGVAAVIYAVGMIFLKWGGIVSDAVFLIIGIFVGLVLLDVVDMLFPSARPLLHGMVGVVTISIASFFVVTSSGSIMGSGVVLSLLLRVVSEQIHEYVATGQIMSWFTSQQSVGLQQGAMVTSVFIFLLFSYVFATLP